MSLKVIELNDSSISVGNEDGIIAQSPGFALAAGNTLEIGEAAEQQARLQPTNSYNKYWHELNLEPLSHGNNIRHFADIAYAQLLHLAEIGQIDSDVIFAVPGNFTRQQLAILLGLTKQCPFTPVGVVNSALAAASIGDYSESTVYADIQLHQVELTKLSFSGGELSIDSVIQVPGVGTQNFMDSMMQLATRLFIQQCRFNPQHNAASEQQLYNELPSWLRQSDGDHGSLMMELKTDEAVHTAKMPRENLVSSLNGHYQIIRQHIAALATEHGVRILVNSRMSTLPGFVASLQELPNLAVLDPHIVNSACYEFRGSIISGQEGIHLVDKLPVKAKTKGRSLSAKSAEQDHDEHRNQPTHALYSYRAVTVGAIEITNQSRLNGHAATAQSIVMSLPGLPEKLGRIEKRPEGIFLDCWDNEVLLNNNRVSGQQPLKIGDRIQFTEDSEEICLIQVNNNVV